MCNLGGGDKYRVDMQQKGLKYLVCSAPKQICRGAGVQECWKVKGVPYSSYCYLPFIHTWCSSNLENEDFFGQGDGLVSKVCSISMKT